MVAATCTAAVLLAAGAATSVGTDLASDVAGHTTVEQTVCATNPAGGGCLAPSARDKSAYYGLQLGPGEPYITRELDSGAAALPGREQRRRSMLYFGDLSDLHVVDEESPARVEFLDPDENPAPFSSAWRPQEALQPFTANEAIRQMNRFTAQSPVPQGDGSRASMAFTVVTGDSADNKQRNEAQWDVRLLEGGLLDPNSGSSNPADYAGCPPGSPGPAEAARYTGVQDYNDYFEGVDPAFYDPNDPRGTKWSNWPGYPGLMDRAQQPFQAEGLNVPSYVSMGNHETLVQGNQWANREFEAVAIGCQKEMAPSPDVRDLQSALTNLSPSYLTNLLASDPTKVALVPPDPQRQFLSQKQYREVYGPPFGNQSDAHGLSYVDPQELSASRGAASYYAWSPRPGFRFISLDTSSVGGIAGPSADGNVDEPQFRWLEGELQAATSRDELVFVFSHHAPDSMKANVPDETAPACNEPGTPGADDGHGHDTNPGCDADPRVSTPIHLGEPGQRPPGDTTETVSELLLRYPNAIAFVGGHSHVNQAIPYRRTTGGGFWSVKTASEIDWFQQSRVIDVMDNRDGTLSLFATDVDQGADSQAPPPGTPAAQLSDADLASLSRTFAYNDPQIGGGFDEGTPSGRNVELLVSDPRPGYARPKGATPLRTALVTAYAPCATPNRTHGPPLGFGSCSPPSPASNWLTVGSPDANGRSANSVGSLRLDVVVGNPLTSADEADVQAILGITDVRRRSDLADYTGDIEANVEVRLTDRLNGVTATGTDSATVIDFPFPVRAPCSATADPAAGATCGITTSFNAVVPGAVKEGTRAIWQAGQVRVMDGGSDGDVTTQPNTLFAVQGLLVP